MPDGRSGTNPLLRAFNPTSLGLTAWYRSGATSGDVTSWAEVLGGAALTFNAARAPTAQSNKALRFTAATPDVGGVLIGANNFNRDYLGIVFRAKPSAVVTNQTFFSLNIGTAGAGARILDFMIASAALRVDVYSAGSAGRRYTYNSVASTAARQWELSWNKDGAGENDRTIVFRDAVELVPSSSTDLGAGGVPTQLVAAGGGGRILFGNFNDSAVASNPFGGDFGWDIFIRAGSRMTGATRGIFTTAARTNMLAFEPLT